MRIIITCIAALISAGIAIASDQAPPDSQLGMNQEAEQRLRVAEAEMNRIFERLSGRAAENPGAAAKLREAQHAWQEYRDAQLKALFYLPSNESQGSVFPMCAATIKAQLTEARIKELKSLYSPPEGDVCAPRW